MIAAVTELFRSQYQKQPDYQVNDGDTGKESCHATHHVMEDGEEFQMFAVRILL